MVDETQAAEVAEVHQRNLSRPARDNINGGSVDLQVLTAKRWLLWILALSGEWNGDSQGVLIARSADQVT